MMSSTVVNCENIKFNYGPVRALSGFNFAVQEGEISAILGSNGAGKTTSVRLMNGLLLPDSGTCSILGMNIQEHGPDIRMRTGVLTEGPALYERLTARENLIFFGGMYGLDEESVRHHGNELLEFFGLLNRADSRVATFSKGMKQRLALVRALIHSPNLLFLDEPTSDLDPEASRQVQDLVRKIGKEENHTVIICTHRLAEAERICDRVAILKSGYVAASGSLEELRKQVMPEIHVFIRVHDDLEESDIRKVSGVEGVISAEIENERSLTIQIMQEPPIPAVVDLLVHQGVKILSVEPKPATLEDIYLKIQNGERGGTA